MVFCNFVGPMALLSNRKTRTISGIFIASAMVVTGMWLERLIIVVPTLENPALPFPHTMYVPTLTEWSLFAAAVAAFIMGFMLFAKLFPIISVWEVQEGRALSVKETVERIEEYLPAEGTSLA
jgi:molybdopterin-containing oxidoreductase family membrane subunit